MSVKEEKKKLKLEHILIIIISISIILLLVFSSGFTIKNTSNSGYNYCEIIEVKIEKTLSQIKGVGSVKASVYISESVIEKTLKNTITTNENGIISIKEEVVLISGKPYKIGEEYPQIISCIIVCEGADNLQVRTLITSVLTSLNIDSEKIQIYKMK